MDKYKDELRAGDVIIVRDRPRGLTSVYEITAVVGYHSYDVKSLLDDGKLEADDTATVSGRFVLWRVWGDGNTGASVEDSYAGVYRTLQAAVTALTEDRERIADAHNYTYEISEITGSGLVFIDLPPHDLT